MTLIASARLKAATKKAKARKRAAVGTIVWAQVVLYWTRDTNEKRDLMFTSGSITVNG